MAGLESLQLQSILAVKSAEKFFRFCVGGQGKEGKVVDTEVGGNPVYLM